MGNFLSGLGQKGQPTNAYSLYLDFENATPTAVEESDYSEVYEAIKDYPTLLEKLESFDGCAEEIKLSIANPKDLTLEEKTWNALIPRITTLKSFYEFSTRLTVVLPILLRALCSDDDIPKTLETKQSLTKLFAEIFYFVLRFDELKMGNSSVQNVFPYYRRLLSRRKTEEVLNDVIVNEELANKMTLFYASTTPMLTVMSDTTTKFVKSGEVPDQNVTNCLSVIATVCKEMVDSPEYESKLKANGSVNFVLRVMIGVTILYDHIHPIGAFSKKSDVDIRGIIRVLKEPSRVSSTEVLVNALRYRTKHLNDEDTPKAVKNLLES